jgi:hypothetical protein
MAPPPANVVNDVIAAAARADELIEVYVGVPDETEVLPVPVVNETLEFGIVCEAPKAVGTMDPRL